MYNSHLAFLFVTDMVSPTLTALWRTGAIVMWKCVVSRLPPSTRYGESRSVEDREKTVTVSSSVSNITHQDEAGIFVLQLFQRGAVPEGRVQLLLVQRSAQAPVAQRGVTLLLALSLLSLDHLGQMDLKDWVSKPCSDYCGYNETEMFKDAMWKRIYLYVCI